MLRRATILARLARVKDLPSAPPVLESLLQKLNDDRSSIDDIVSLIEQDVALSAKVLSLANSPIYRARTEITSVKNAAVRIGFDEIRNLALVAVVSSSLSSLSIPEPRRFWLHSLAVGYTAEVLGKKARTPLPAELRNHLFTAGLLHDLGALVLYHLFPEETTALMDRLPESEKTMFELEEEEWGITHAEAGAILARYWKLPSALQEAMAYHHTPWESSADTRTLVAAIHLADFIANNQEFSRLGDNFPQEFDASSWELFSLDLDDVPDIIEEVRRIGERSEVFVALL